MTITTPKGFKRSSERDLATQQGISELKRMAKAEAEHLRRDEELESLACGFSPSSAADLTETPSWERRFDAMIAEDLSTYDADGLVR